MPSKRTQDEWESFLVHTKIGASRKLGRLTPAQRWIWVGGVLALAAKSPIRGHLLIELDEPAVAAQDVALAAGVTPAAARTALESFRRLNLIEPDDELGCERVRNWSKHQPSIRDEASKARERKRRQRRRDTLKAAEKEAA